VRIIGGGKGNQIVLKLTISDNVVHKIKLDRIFEELRIN